MKRGEMAVERARALIGTRFVAQGRDVQGIDCVGLVVAAFAIDRSTIRDDYRMAGNHGAAIKAVAERWFRRVSRRRLVPGDLLLMRPGAMQWHLAIWTGEGLIHADARRRMVVERPGTPEWPIIAALRARRRAKGN